MKKSTKPLTAKQRKVLKFIQANCRMCGPTVREIATAFGIRSTNGVVCHLEALEKKGAIKRYPSKTRGIEVVG